MSGGFFRGTSAEQDTRFSNKQAKLLKTQKFAAELDQPVDMTKVKMDVIRPWIATRATELLGFEDEVLINFVYGLLDGKVVDGKKIQIQLTGFMEKNTGKFMRELWGLLLSAQNNASGVPQQFLDAKEEELKKKKAENDRITQEIQKKREKEGRDVEIERAKRMDGEANNSKVASASSPTKHSTQRSSSIQPGDERDFDRRHGSRTRTRRTPSPGRSLSKSPSKSRSSRERRRMRNQSVSPDSRRLSLTPRRQYHSPRRRSMSSERRFRSPPRSSISPRHKYSPKSIESPSRHRTPYTRRRSPSVSRHRPPVRRRSPYSRRRSPSYERRRSPSPLRRRSPSPLRRRSPFPLRHRSPSPLRRRSPVKSRRRSPSPLRRRSPVRRRSISPARHRSLSPVKRRSPLQRSPGPRKSPVHSPKIRADSRISPHQRKRSLSPYKSPSPSYPSHRSSSRETDSKSNGFDSNVRSKEIAFGRGREKRSPMHDALRREAAGQYDSRRKVSGTTSRSLQISHGSKDRNEIDSRDYGVRSKKSPIKSPSNFRQKSPRRDSPSGSLVKKSRKWVHRSESPRTSSEDEQDSPTRTNAIHKAKSSDTNAKDLGGEKNKKTFCAIDFRQEDHSPSGLEVSLSPANGNPHANSFLKKEDEEKNSVMNVMLDHVQPVSEYPEDIEYGPGRTSGGKQSLEVAYDGQSSAKNVSRDKQKSDPYELSEKKLKKKLEQINELGSTESESEETATRKYKGREKRKYRKSSTHKKDLDYSSDSDSDEDKKRAKRRREEKKLRKEDRRRRHEEKHRKKLERRADKVKLKMDTTVTPPSDFEKEHNDAGTLEDEAAVGKVSSLPDTAEIEQKKLEIELREKALQTFRAKKATNN